MLPFFSTRLRVEVCAYRYGRLIAWIKLTAPPLKQIWAQAEHSSVAPDRVGFLVHLQPHRTADRLQVFVTQKPETSASVALACGLSAARGRAHLFLDYF